MINLILKSDGLCPKCRTADFNSCHSMHCPVRLEPMESKTSWYSKNEIYDFLRIKNYSHQIAEELSEMWAKDLQGAFDKGVEKTKREASHDSPSVTERPDIKKEGQREPTFSEFLGKHLSVVETEIDELTSHGIALKFAETFQNSYPKFENPIWKMMEDLRKDIDKLVEQEILRYTISKKP